VFLYAHLQNILFVHIHKCNIISQPLHLRTILQGYSAIHHVVVLAEPLCNITIIDEEFSPSFASAKSKHSGYVSSFVEVAAQEGAEVTYVSLQNYDHHIQHHIERKATAAKDAKVNWVEAYFGAQYTRSTVSAVLEEDGAASTNTTVFFGDGTQKFDIMSRTIQIGKHTYADMNTIGVI
ncbi:MAG: SufD family Fe-S cluster assembly protein, partial [Thaumarchaeota archaeon]|nr:SufD family Fe-S cluster assembly protein [Nitrososphaerota archaeon]